MKRIVVLISVLMLLASVAWADSVTRKNLGDINGDGIKEVAVESWSLSGSDGGNALVKFFSGKRLILDKVAIGGDSYDKYKVIGRQIVSWQGDWSTGSKWDPHYYNLVWYSWDKKSKKYQISREGFTKKSYSYEQAKKRIGLLAAKPDQSVILSKSTTFLVQTKALAEAEIGTPVLKVYVDDPRSELNEARRYTFNFPMTKKYPNLLYVSVGILRNGKLTIIKVS